MSGHSRQRILLVIAESPDWKHGRSWSYSVQLGIEEGLSAHRVRYLTITTPFLSRARELVEGRQFDQVWVEVVHTASDERFLEWVASLAPVRIGFIGESLQYLPAEYELFPRLRGRMEAVEGRCKHLTHVVACDEKDAADIAARQDVATLWWPQAVPRQFIADGPLPPPKLPGVFGGVAYGERKRWLENPALEGLLVRGRGAEDGTVLPMLFDLLHLAARHSLGERTSAKQHIRLLRKLLVGLIRYCPTARRDLARPLYLLRAVGRSAEVDRILAAYLSLLRTVRRESFALWLGTLQESGVVVNLPSLVKAYAGRVVEGMAAGRPIVSWAIPDRPRTAELFEDGEEILLYSQDEPSQLADRIRRILGDADYARRIAGNARRKLLRFHTMEERVGQILDWVETGGTPVYC